MKRLLLSILILSVICSCEKEKELRNILVGEYKIIDYVESKFVIAENWEMFDSTQVSSITELELFLTESEYTIKWYYYIDYNMVFGVSNVALLIEEGTYNISSVDYQGHDVLMGEKWEGDIIFCNSKGGIRKGTFDFYNYFNETESRLIMNLYNSNTLPYYENKKLFNFVKIEHDS